MQQGKVVITGGTGFIMSHTAEKLVEMGKDVTLFARNIVSLDEKTQELLKTKKNLKFVQGDIRDRVAVDKLVKDAETVYHFAALMGTSSRFGEWEIPTIEVNVIGNINVLQASLKEGVRYFVHCPRPALTVWLTPYIISKTAQTQFTEMYNKIYGLPAIGVNVQNCYGPRERAILNPDPYKPNEGRKLIASSIISALKNEPIIVFGDGEQSSDFVFIDDVVNGCLKAPNDAAIGTICDLGTGVSTPVKKVAEMIKELTRSKSVIEFAPLRTGEVKLHTKADLENPKKYLNWEPTIGLEEGLRRTIPYYAKLIGVKSPV